MSEHFTIDEGDYRITIAETRGRLPWHWSVVHRDGEPPWQHRSGRASSQEYAIHDARSQVSAMRRELEERAA